MVLRRPIINANQKRSVVVKIMIGVCHPKDVHFWKNIISNLTKNSHEIKIVAWDKDVTIYLLKVYGFDYELIGKSSKNLIGKLYDMFLSDVRVLKVAMKFKPDLFLQGDPYLAHVSTMLRKPHIDFCDTEHANLVHLSTFPFSNRICTPSCFMKKINPAKHIPFDGYFELAYLHPNHFEPDPSILNDLGLNEGDEYIVVRFVSWGASHDIGQHGVTDKEIFVKRLEKYGKIFITSEHELKDNFEKYRITISPEKIHHLLYYAKMYVGEGATMACEAAVLGTPSIYVNTLRLGYLDELEDKYGLVYNFSNAKDGQQSALKKAVDLLENEKLEEEWLKKREKMLRGKGELIGFFMDLIEDFSTVS